MSKGTRSVLARLIPAIIVEGLTWPVAIIVLVITNWKGGLLAFAIGQVLSFVITMWILASLWRNRKAIGQAAMNGASRAMDAAEAALNSPAMQRMEDALNGPAMQRMEKTLGEHPFFDGPDIPPGSPGTRGRQFG